MSEVSKGIRALARVYAGWGFSQAFYWDQIYTQIGYSSLEDFLVGFWEGFFLDNRDPNNLLTMLWTWQNGNIGNTPDFDGDHVKALKSIKAKLVRSRPRRTSTSRPRTRSTRSSTSRTASCNVIPGVWGHFAGGGINPGRHRVHRRRAQEAARRVAAVTRRRRAAPGAAAGPASRMTARDTASARPAHSDPRPPRRP